MIAIIDYDIGNLAAVENMLHRLEIACEITARQETIERADKIILPGNGAFDACMTSLRASGLVPLLETRVLRDKIPVLGICVGAQMLGTGSEEGSEPGLGWLDMKVKLFPPVPGLRVPHMGWSHVTPLAPGHPLVQGVEEETRYYFVHSFYMEPVDPENVLLTAHYGIDFAAAVCAGNIAGVQFHPEKSHRFGKQLLASFGKEF
jgi:glutamine amidotransferase